MSLGHVALYVNIWEGGPRGDLCMLTCNTVHMYIRDSAGGSSDPEEALGNVGRRSWGSQLSVGSGDIVFSTDI